MRALIWLLLIGIAATVAATLLGGNDGLVSVFYAGQRVDVSLNLALVLLLAAVLLLYVGLRTVSALLALPEHALAWRNLKRERAAGAALRQALAEFFAARYARAQRAAQIALDLQDDVPELRGNATFAVQAHLLAASSAHRLQDRAGRDQRLVAAQAAAKDDALLRDGVQLMQAEWRLDDRDATRALAALAELPPGVARRTQALRLRLQASRQQGRPLEALQTARLLAKHQAFSAVGAQALLRSLAFEALDGAFDGEQLRAVWAQLEATDRRDGWVAARAARRAARLGEMVLGCEWLAPHWDHLADAEPDMRRELALALIDCAGGLPVVSGTGWLARVETALARAGADDTVVAAAGMAFAQRQLWGKARRPLERAAKSQALPSPVRQRALRTLAAMARAAGDEASALMHEQAIAHMGED
ncbi:MAG: heme biosynthesis protein HemY [Proteobacteria bacterium]|nr:heme biosynthesis protein HemY [Pseudomonadota bacterium]